MNPIKASLGWSAGTPFVSRTIRRLDRVPGISPAVNHVYYRFDFPDDGALIYESHISGGVQITPYEHLLSAKVKGIVYYVHEIPLDCDPVLLWNDCIPLHGKHYDTGQIVRYYLWRRLFRRKNKKILKLFNDDRYTCNEFIISAGRQVVDAIAPLDYSYTPNRLLEYFMQL